jgi:archaeal preflagellin peptidase FlaK
LTGAGSYLEATRVLVLVAGLAYASKKDLEDREVSDRLWQVLGVAGAVLGAVALAGGGALPVLLWVLISALVLEHLFPWDNAFSERQAGTVLVLEFGAYAVSLAIVGFATVRWGIGPTAVPFAVIAALVTVLLARLLFELRVLYGGADAKALIVAGALVPVFASPVLLAPATSATLLTVLPFALTLLTDAALLAVAVPVVIAVRNVVRGEFSLPRGFTSYTLEVDALPRRFVWVRDPALGEDTLADDAETTAEDTRRRTELAAKLRARGVRRVWVTPQLPFLVLMTAGAVAALLAGNLLLDLLAVL